MTEYFCINYKPSCELVSYSKSSSRVLGFTKEFVLTAALIRNHIVFTPCLEA